MNIEKQNRQESLETGASLDQNREQILQNNPNFYKNKPSNKAGKKISK